MLLSSSNSFIGSIPHQDTIHTLYHRFFLAPFPIPSFSLLLLASGITHHALYFFRKEANLSHPWRPCSYHVSEAPVRHFQAGFYTAFVVLYDNVNYILFRKDVFVFLLFETVNSLELRDHFLSIP